MFYTTTLMIIVFLECAKVRASRSFVPYVPTCLTCSRAYVPLLRTSSYVHYVSSVFYVPYVPSFFTWLKWSKELQPHATEWLFHETFFLVLVRFSMCCVLAFHISVVVMRKKHMLHCVKNTRTRVLSRSHIPIFWLNTGICLLSAHSRIHYKYLNMQTR